MATTREQVDALQGEIIDQSNLVFDDMKIISDNARGKAETVFSTVTLEGWPANPSIPTVTLAIADLEKALAYLADLRTLLDPTKPLLYPADYYEPDYASTLLTALNNLLYSDLINGGYGINTSDEESLWNRARERELRGMASQQDAATRQFAVAGFPMPTGAAQHAIQQIQQEASEKIATLGREIAIKRADLYVENRKHAISAATEIEKTRMGNFAAKMDRLLEKWKAGVTKTIEEFRVRAQVYASIAGAYTALFGANAGLAEAQASLAIGVMNANVAVFRAEFDKVLEKAKLELEQKKAEANVYLGLAMAAMSSMNVNTGMSAQSQVGQSVSQSTDDDVSYIHNYQEK